MNDSPLLRTADEKAPRTWDIWKEVDPRMERYVQIQSTMGFNVAIRTVVQVDGRWANAPRSRISYVKPERFNGQRGGYVLHERSQR